MGSITISEKSSVRMSVSALLGVIGLTAGTVTYHVGVTEGLQDRADEAFSTAAQALVVAEGAKSEVSDLALTVRIGNVKRDMKDLQRELRQLKRDLEEHPESSLIVEQIDEVEDELDVLRDVLSCYRSGNSDRCET